jgi:DNA-binding PadR family transcriptional regulator
MDIHNGQTMAQTSASFFVLLALSKGPSHGLGIAEDVAQFTEGEVLLGPGTLYRCLKELSEAGAIERVQVDEAPDVPHRKYYRLTASGEMEAARTLHGLTRLAEVGKARLGDPLPQGA